MAWAAMETLYINPSLTRVLTWELFIKYETLSQIYKYDVHGWKEKKTHRILSCADLSVCIK